MTLHPGQTLSHYRLDQKIGAGGMGEVWRATDTTLGRVVAIKVIPEVFITDPERLARFEREAKLLASLNHPNIAVVHGLHREGNTPFLAMELVEGDDLARRLTHGPLAIDEAIAIATQVAEAIEAAHESGVIHRDLKPANIQVAPDGRIKVLDFGLAKALEADPASGGGSPEHSPTVTTAGTRAGVILGTAAYMSPEQARGRAVDRRADIWSFGCVLYEMLAGKQAFGGDTISDTLAAVLKTEPDLSSLPAATPLRVVELLKRCLVKDAKQRLRDIGDARIALTHAYEAPEIATPVGPPTRSGRGWLWVAGGLLAGALATGAGLRLFSPSAPAPAPELRKFSISVPQLTFGFDSAGRISPDGRFIVYTSRGRLWVRDLHRFEATEIPGSEGAISPSWSFDGTQIGFAKDKKLWTWALAGGQSTEVCALPGVAGFNHATWNKDNKIVFAAWRGGLYEVAATGGEPRLVLAPADTEVDFHHPHFLPDGWHIVTVAHRKEGAGPVVVISVPDGKRRDLATFEGLETVVPSPSGHLLLTFTSGQQKILAVPFSASTTEITGETFLVAVGGQYPSVSSTGTLVYGLGSSYAQRELAWVDHDGRSSQLAGRPQLGLDSPALSPDGRKVAIVAYEKENADIWVHDLARGTRSRLVAGPQDEISPVWSPAGDRIFYRQLGNVSSKLMEIPADGTGAPRVRVESVANDVFSATPDGKALVFAVEKAGHSSLWRLDLNSNVAPVSITPNTSVDESEATLSPDGRWLAYLSDEAGPSQVFVRRFPEGSQKQQVSLNGGSYPSWARTGATLLYWEGEALMEVPVQAGATLTVGTARQLFTAGDVGLALSDASGKPPLDVAADGRFLVVRRSSEDPRRGILVVENWMEEFRKR